jgi:thiol-disulfide isomerase/thioredoxin
MVLRIRAALLLSFLTLATIWASAPARAEALDLSAYRGKVVYLDFWASWCNPCRTSFPWMNEMQSSLGRKGLVIIAVNVDHDRDLADEFLRSNGADFKIVYDPDGEIARHYNFKDMPTSILIGRDGKVRSVHNGFFPNREDSYFADIETLLNERSQ